jgi:hypothetical protein
MEDIMDKRPTIEKLTYLMEKSKTPALLAAASLGGEALLGYLECLADEDPSILPLIQGDQDWNRIAEALNVTDKDL